MRSPCLPGQSPTRRRFLQGAAAGGFAIILPAGGRSLAAAAERPVFATIGLRNQGWTITSKSFPFVDFAALADVDANVLAENVAKVEKAAGRKPDSSADYQRDHRPRECFGKKSKEQEAAVDTAQETQAHGQTDGRIVHNALNPVNLSRDAVILLRLDPQEELPEFRGDASESEDREVDDEKRLSFAQVSCSHDAGDHGREDQLPDKAA